MRKASVISMGRISAEQNKQTENPERKLKKKYYFTSTRVIAAGFFLVMLLGALLLMIPAATVEGETTTFLTAMFTSATSICVTGLVVVDTFSHWTLFGKIVILCMIQIGGFGVITVYAMLLITLKKRISLYDRALIQDYYNMNSIRGMIRFLLGVVKGTVIVELSGAVLYMFVFVPEMGFIRGAWVSLFTSVSGFCNAGIDIIGPSSLTGYRTNVPVNLITMMLIIMGGLGYVVWFDVAANIKKTIRQKMPWRTFLRRLNEHSRLVLTLTAVLITSGTLLVYIFEKNNPATLGGLSTGNKIMASMFQSVTFRTAGFATVPQDALTTNSCLVGLIYMFIGGSPVGTAGGVKTVTFFVLVLNTVSFIRNRDETVVFNRRITQKMINKATAVVTISLSVTLICVVLLLQTNDVTALSAAYEIFSATGTVGLSRSLTPSLNAAGQVIVIFAMYAGRIGPISMAIFFNTGRSKHHLKYLEGKFFVG